MIYTHNSSKKTRKQKKKMATAWEAQQKQYGPQVKTKFSPLKNGPVIGIRAGAEDFKKVSSLKTNAIDTFDRPAPVYTGTSMIGIATMHKSNSVPVFNSEAAKDISKMRRD
jgi:hypothetical protein